MDEILQAFQQHFYPDVGQAMSSRLALDDQRLDDLFRTWLPIATGGPITVTKTDRKGREYTEMDVDTPVRAAGIVLTAIQRRIQLAMACRPESVNGGKDASSTNVLVWLSQVLPGVQKAVDQGKAHAPGEQLDGHPGQTLVLECAAESDINNSNGSIG